MAQQREARQWTVLEGDFATEAEFRQQVIDDLMGVEFAGHRLGRAFIVAPLRVQDEQGAYFTAGWMFEETFVPAVRRAAPEAPAEPAPEPELTPEEIAEHFPEQEPVGA